MVGQIWTSDSGTPRVTGGEGSGKKDIIKEGSGAFGSVATFEPGPIGTLSYEHKQPLSLMDKTVQVTPQVMRMLGELLEREVTRDDPEWAAAMASVTVSEKVKIKPSRRQHKENESDCRTIVQQLVSSIPQNVSTSTSFKGKKTVERDTKENLTFEDEDQKGEEVEQNL